MNMSDQQVLNIPDGIVHLCHSLSDYKPAVALLHVLMALEYSDSGLHYWL